MEVVAYGILSTIWWMASLSVLLPFVLLLKFSKSFQNKWFSFFFTKILGPIFDGHLMPKRKRAFELLNESLTQRNTDIPLEVLEIGVGSGANLTYYPENSNLTAMDLNESFENYFKENQKKYPQVKYKDTVIANAENMLQIQDSSMDLVICTYVMCSVGNLEAVISEVKRVLKPGGKFLFLEHVAYPKTAWNNTIQRFVNPLWHLYFNGCMLNRNIAEEVEKMSWSAVTVERSFSPSLNMFVRPQVIGIATK